MSEPSNIRLWEAEARSTEIPGRLLCTVRDHHFVIDGPVQNGFPGEAVTPGEQFLSSIAACGAELVQMLAAKEDIPLRAARVHAEGRVDLDDQPHPTYKTFNSLRFTFELKGVTPEQAELLVERFKGR